jgi:predicted amidohydrolase YtcJ
MRFVFATLVFLMAHSVFADLIITNATLRMGDADAIAIVGNQISAIGSSVEMVAKAGKETRIIDAKRRLVLSGFNDAHVHFVDGGFGLSRVDLRGAKSPGEFTERIRKFAEKTARGRWILGGRWDHENWPGAQLPTRQMIDAATTNIPVFVRRLDGHMGVANTIALVRAGITRNTKDPDGGAIVRDASGEPTGVLKDAAMDLLNKFIPAASREEKLAGARAATAEAARLGVTSVQDMSADEDVEIYQTLMDAGELKTRIYAVAPLPRWEDLAKIGFRAPFGNAMIRIGGLKGFADGSLGSTTALFFEPYNDAPETRGLPGDQMFPEGAMLKRVLGADQKGLQVMIHAIGDRANDEILGMYEEAGRRNGSRDRRFRIEHAQHLRAQDIARFARGGVVASMQPYHCADDGRWAEKRIGKQRCETTYAFRYLLDSGAKVAFGSDWPVAPLNPLEGIWAAVTRRTLDGKHPEGWIPEQKISVEEAVAAFTRGSAFAEFQEAVKGSLAVGLLADLILLDRNIFEIPAAEIKDARVLLTVVDGKIVFEAK